MARRMRSLRTMAVARRFSRTRWSCRAFQPGRRIGREETGADRAPSNPWLLRTSPAANIRAVRTTLPWCSIQSREEATPGLAASRCRSRWPGRPATASTRRARCGRSFVSIGSDRSPLRRHIRRRDAAVDQEGGAGGEGGLVGGEEEGGLGDLVRLAEAAHGNVDEAAPALLFGVEILHQELGAQ